MLIERNQYYDMPMQFNVNFLGVLRVLILLLCLALTMVTHRERGADPLPVQSTP